MEINLEYLKGELSNNMSSVSKKIQSAISKLGAISIPEAVPGTAAPDCAGKIQSASDSLKSSLDAVSNSSSIISELIRGFEWAENYAMGAAISLSENVKYTENSKGEGRSNTVRKDNEYANPDDVYTVKYIAVYADGKYKYNMILDENNKGQSIDAIIDKLKAEGEISEDAEITVSQGVVNEKSEIGWLPQMKYKPHSGDSITGENNDNSTSNNGTLQSILENTPDMDGDGEIRLTDVIANYKEGINKEGNTWNGNGSVLNQLRRNKIKINNSRIFELEKDQSSVANVKELNELKAQNQELENAINEDERTFVNRFYEFKGNFRSDSQKDELKKLESLYKDYSNAKTDNDKDIARDNLERYMVELENNSSNVEKVEKAENTVDINEKIDNAGDVNRDGKSDLKDVIAENKVKMKGDNTEEDSVIKTVEDLKIAMGTDNASIEQLNVLEENYNSKKEIYENNKSMIEYWQGRKAELSEKLQDDSLKDESRKKWQEMLDDSEEQIKFYNSYIDDDQKNLKKAISDIENWKKS